MACREFIDFFIAYFDRNLSTRERAEFERHLAECPDCPVYLKSYEDTIKLGRAAFAEPNAPVPPQVPEQLVQAILASRRRST